MASQDREATLPGTLASGPHVHDLGRYPGLISVCTLPRGRDTWVPRTHLSAPRCQLQPVLSDTGDHC